MSSGQSTSVVSVVVGWWNSQWALVLPCGPRTRHAHALHARFLLLPRRAGGAIRRASYGAGGQGRGKGGDVVWPGRGHGGVEVGILSVLYSVFILLPKTMPNTAYGNAKMQWGSVSRSETPSESTCEETETIGQELGN